MKCSVCLKNSVHVDNYSILLFLAFVSPALLMGKSIPVLTDSLPVWTDCSRGKGVGWVIWPFSIINPLFKQSVKISQFTQTHSMNVFQAGNELSWLISRGWMSCLWGTSCPTQWPNKACDKPGEMGYIYGVHVGFPGVTSSLSLPKKIGNQIKPGIRVEHLFPRHLVIRHDSKSRNLQNRDNYTCLLYAAQRQGKD